MQLLDDTPEPSQNLAFCKSMRRRRRQTFPTQLPMATLSNLREWGSDPSSSMLLAQGQGIKKSSLDFSLDFLDAILDRDYPVIWALPGDNDRGQPTPSITGILGFLISQLLELEPASGAASNGPSPVRLRQLQGNTDIRHWFQLLERCIAFFPCLCIFIDTSLLKFSLEDEARDGGCFTLTAFIDRMSEIVTRRDKDELKVLVVSWKFDTTTSMEASDVFKDMQFATIMGRRV